MRRRLTKEKQLEIENAALREAIESALADLAMMNVMPAYGLCLRSLPWPARKTGAKDRFRNILNPQKEDPSEHHLMRDPMDIKIITSLL